MKTRPRIEFPNDEPLVGPGVYDCLSAMMAQKSGFKFAFISGYALSATRLGEPDFGLLTPNDIIQATDQICNAVDIPIIVDIDTGYGNAFNVERIVKQLIKIGACGCILEDQQWPKRCGHMENKKVIDIDEYLFKLDAILNIKNDDDFFVIARTDSRSVLGLDEAIKRAQLFAKRGADAVFVEAPQSIDELKQIADSVPDTILMANMLDHGKTPVLNFNELYSMGYQLIAVSLAPILSVADVLRSLFTDILAQNGTKQLQGRMITFEEMNNFLGLKEKYAREKKIISSK